MTLRHGQRLVAPDGAEDWNAATGKSVAYQREMTIAGDLVEDDAGELDAIAIARKAERDRGCGLRLAGNIDHQHHGPAGRRRDVGGRAVAPGPWRSHAVEQPHHAFGQRKIGVIGSAEQRIEPASRLRP